MYRFRARTQRDRNVALVSGSCPTVQKLDSPAPPQWRLYRRMKIMVDKCEALLPAGYPCAWRNLNYLPYTVVAKYSRQIALPRDFDWACTEPLAPAFGCAELYCSEQYPRRQVNWISSGCLRLWGRCLFWFNFRTHLFVCTDASPEIQNDGIHRRTIRPFTWKL